MKDIVITKKRILLEIFFMVAAFAVAEGMNIYAIKKFNTSWDELWSQWLTILILTALFYVLFAVVRTVLRGFCVLFKSMKKDKQPAA